MLHASLLPVTDTRTTSTSPTPTSTPTTSLKTLLTTVPLRTTTTATPTKTAVVVAAPFSCVNNVCTATGQVGFTFQTLQSLINMANKKLGNTAIAVDGKIDARTVNAFMPVSRTVGGTLAIFDQAATPNLLATNAEAYARGIAQWLGMTWVEATPTVPGHWERLRVGQTTVNLPSMPVQPAPSTMQPVVTAPTAPTAPTTPAPTTPPVMVMYVCADGTRVSDPAACPKPPSPLPAPSSTTPSNTGIVPPSITPPPASTGPAQGPTAPPPSVTPTPQPSDLPVPGATSGRYSGCIARFNRTRKVFSIYCPIGSVATQPGLGFSDGEYFRCLRGNCVGLGETEVTPPPPSGFVKAAEVTTLPGAGETQAGEERDKFWRLGNPLMWAAIAGAATVVGGGSYMLYRRKRSA